MPETSVEIYCILEAAPTWVQSVLVVCKLRDGRLRAGLLPRFEALIVDLLNICLNFTLFLFKTLSLNFKEKPLFSTIKTDSQCSGLIKKKYSTVKNLPRYIFGTKTKNQPPC